MSNPSLPGSPLYRIGALAKQVGLAVTTIRSWENRYGAFSPVKSSGKHRMYLPQDLHKAILLKKLCDSGHSISTIAGLELTTLRQMVQEAQLASMSNTQERLSNPRVCLAVVGTGLASRIEAKKFTLRFLDSSIHISDIFFDVAGAQAATLSETPDLILIKTSSLQNSDQAQILEMLAHHKIGQAIVIYNYSQQSVVDSMKRTGLVLRREPVSDDDLAELIGSVLLIEGAQSDPNGQTLGAIPPRRYSEKTLARVAGISTSVLCECPKHVAELIAQLASFEQYSQQCLNKSPQDSDLHAYLSAVSGSARNLFERALERVAAHEGIDLSET